LVKNLLKTTLAWTLVVLGADRIGRRINRHRLLTVMFHGITRQGYTPPVWTQLPEKVFRRQIEFLCRYYQPVTMGQVVEAVIGGSSLPEQAVLITFDDGLRNNATVAWPILKKMGVPAAIFLTVDFIGTDRFFWVDELYLFLVEAAHQGRELPLDDRPQALSRMRRGDIWGAYLDIVESCKRIPEMERDKILNRLAEAVPFERTRYAEDFGLMGWDQVRAMDQEGQIEFGVHTATHRILTQTDPEILESEIAGAKRTLEFQLGHPVDTFCYPNGRRGLDFLPEHENIIRQAGYRCAFTTNNGLYSPLIDDSFSISRVPSGNDQTSHPALFKLSAARINPLKL
jgi:peptidoglycan/xylan/chitin deacetylase (PgdA/CDA1 family)